MQFKRSKVSLSHFSFKVSAFSDVLGKSFPTLKLQKYAHFLAFKKKVKSLIRLEFGTA